ncbi:hypothetical protein [Xenorhabdus bovienii]|uniref:hypothetical protein n=1 Tax=Xenorhabdus bovienii TaxID=40576 RepID=UPI0023B21054|nr:hypothetical protein [Xenorhabdus bovienii]MDE9494548.1 hypothetical protein [Xenorhabdus bovienii]MDE9502945.1 hypothetical protein [Xenorhabdus bovienii]MDE9526595.1 hypothetical protein [Xenorhabdus bovienii]
MDKSVFLKKMESLDGFLTIKQDQQQEVIDAGLLVMEREFERLTNETFLYEAGKPCLNVIHIHLNNSDAEYDLIYFHDLARGKAKSPITYMIGFNDRALSATVSDTEHKTPTQMFDQFVKAYQGQSDEEFIDMPLSELAKALQSETINAEKYVSAFYTVVSVPMPEYSEMKGGSTAVLQAIKDIQGRTLIPALGTALDIVILANSFCDNVINRSARITSNATAEIGMMGEQALSYGLKAASTQIADIQIRGSKLAGMAGMF